MIEVAIVERLAAWDLTLADYGVLHILLTSGEQHQLRPRELQNRLLPTSGGVSGVPNRLRKMGRIEQHQDTDGKRSPWARLTAAAVEAADAAVRAATTTCSATTVPTGSPSSPRTRSAGSARPDPSDDAGVPPARSPCVVAAKKHQNSDRRRSNRQVPMSSRHRNRFPGAGRATPLTPSVTACLHRVLG